MIVFKVYWVKTIGLKFPLLLVFKMLPEKLKIIVHSAVLSTRTVLHNEGKNPCPCGSLILVVKGT